MISVLDRDDACAPLIDFFIGQFFYCQFLIRFILGIRVPKIYTQSTTRVQNENERELKSENREFYFKFSETERESENL